MVKQIIYLTIPMQPTPWQAAQKGRGGYYDPKSKEKDWLRVLLKQQYKGEVLTELVKIIFYFFVEPAKSLSPKKKKALYGNPYDGNMDATNFQKLTEDCLQGIVIKNDRQVWDIHSIALWAENPGINITIETTS